MLQQFLFFIFLEFTKSSSGPKQLCAARGPMFDTTVWGKAGEKKKEEKHWLHSPTWKKHKKSMQNIPLNVFVLFFSMQSWNHRWLQNGVVCVWGVGKMPSLAVDF